MMINKTNKRKGSVLVCSHSTPSRDKQKEEHNGCFVNNERMTMFLAFHISTARHLSFIDHAQHELLIGVDRKKIFI